MNFIHMWASYVLTLGLFSNDEHYLPIEPSRNIIFLGQRYRMEFKEM